MATWRKDSWKSRTTSESAVTATLVIKEGYLEKRQRNRSNPDKNAKNRFQKRYLKLTSNSLVYYEKESSKEPRGDFHVQDIVIVGLVRDADFQKNYRYFQVGNKQEVIYLRTQSEDLREEWMTAIRNAAITNRNKMLEKYHLGIYRKGKWSCCNLSVKESDGCSSRPPQRASSTPIKCIHRSQLSTLEETITFHSSVQVDPESSDELFHNDPVIEEERPTPFSTSSRDSGLGLDGAKISDTSKEDHIKSEALELKQAKRNMKHLLVPPCFSSPFNKNIIEKSLQPIQSLNNFNKVHHFPYENDVKYVTFKDLDHVILATRHEVHLQSVASIQDSITICKDPDEEIVSLSTWRNMVAVKANCKITIFSSEEKYSRITISSEPPCLADFTPDGSSLIIASMTTDISYSNKCDRLRNISLQILPLSELIPGHKLLSLYVHPDPRETYAALLFSDALRNVLCLFIYDYKTKCQHHSTLCIGASILSTIPCAVFSHYNLNLYVVYGKVLSMIDLKDASIHLTEFDNFKDGNSCVQLTSVGRNIGVVFSNGDVLVFDGENNHIIQLYKIELPCSINKLAFSTNGNNLAVNFGDKELHLYKRSPPCHPSESMKMSSIEITRSGKQNVALGHGISVDFPEGFIDEEKIAFRYAVTAGVNFGLFKLPINGRLISAILSLHPEKDVTFKKPISITMPHNLYSETDLIKGIKFCKAKVNNFRTVNGQKALVFSEVSAEAVSQFSRPTQMEDYNEVKEFCATFNTLHTCHYCLASDYFYKQNISDDSQLYIVEIKPLNLGKSSDFYITYAVFEFRALCYTTITEQYPDSEYSLKKKTVISFLPSHNDIIVKIANHSQLEQDGWKATIDGRDKISRSDLDFMDFPVAAMRSLCEQKEFPPRFCIKMSALDEDQPKKSEIAVCIGGALERICKNQDEPKLFVDLLPSDICLPVVREEATSPNEQSCEAQAVQGCLIDMATAIQPDPRRLCFYLLSGFILNQRQIMKLTKPQANTMDEKKSQIIEILLQVHLEITKDSQLFASLCNALTSMDCHPTTIKLKDKLEEIQNKSQQHGVSLSSQKRPSNDLY